MVAERFAESNSPNASWDTLRGEPRKKLTRLEERLPGRHPNFFIVGASKAGTTSLWKYLQQHPDIYLPQDPAGKEPSFFCDLTPPWAFKYRTFDAYLSLFSAAKEEKAVGEASTTYLVSPESPGRIRETCPEAKIIILLRHPVARAWSLYSFLCGLGLEWIVPFEKALAAEEDRFGNEHFKHNNPFWYYGYLYFRSGLYAPQIERYLDAFPRERVRVILLEELKENPRETLRGVFGFLGVDTDFAADTKVHNRGRFPLSVRAQYLIAKACKTHPVLGFDERRRLADKVLRRAFRANLRLGRFRRPGLRPDTRRKLLERYRDDISRTADLIGRNLDHWLQER